MDAPTAPPADFPPADRAAWDDFEDHLRVEMGLAANSIAAYRSDLRLLARWCDTRGGSLVAAGESDLRDYLAQRLRQAQAQPMA